MNIFSIDLTVNEIQLLRQSLDIISIKGTDAKFLSNLQIKLENELIQIQEILKQEESVSLLGLVVNSGCANACTGSQGLLDAKEMSIY